MDQIKDLEYYMFIHIYIDIFYIYINIFNYNNRMIIELRYIEIFMQFFLWFEKYLAIFI